MMTLADVIGPLWPSPLPADLLAASAGVPLSAVGIDSRLATWGSLFVALRGERTDGHRYIGAAYAQGAVAALVEQPPQEAAAVVDTLRATYSAPLIPPIAVVVLDTLRALQAIARARRRIARPDLTVVGVTGSVGKTTTKEAVAAVLRQRDATLQSSGNMNNEIGLPLTLLTLCPEHRYAVLEMGMYDLGEIALLSDIAQPRVGVVTNVEPVHLERLGTIERIAQAKAELIAALPADGLAVLNGDDARVRAMSTRCAAPSLTFGLREGNTVRAREVHRLGTAGNEYLVEVQDPARFGLEGSLARLRSPMPGRHAVWPSLAAVAVGVGLGLSWGEIRRGVAAQDISLRLVPRPGQGGITVLDDTYNSSPLSALAALDLLAELPGRHVAVLGDMLELGDYEVAGHRRVGDRAATAADHLVTVGGRAKHIAEGAIEAGMDPERVHELENNEAALQFLRDWLRQGDVVLIKGSRGMAMEQIAGPLTTEAKV